MLFDFDARRADATQTLLHESIKYQLFDLRYHHLLLLLVKVDFQQGSHAAVGVDDVELRELVSKLLRAMFETSVEHAVVRQHRFDQETMFHTLFVEICSLCSVPTAALEHRLEVALLLLLGLTTSVWYDIRCHLAQLAVLVHLPWSYYWRIGIHAVVYLCHQTH